MNWKPVTTLLLKKLLNRNDMKNSNKILIAFASALLFIPLVGMIYVSQVEYKIGDDRSIERDRAKNDDHFDQSSENMTSKTMLPFNTVNIEDAKETAIYIHFIKDDKFGVKVQNDVKDSIDFNVDASGQLNINLKNRVGSKRNYYTKILIYGPNINQLNVTNASGLFLSAKSDSLTVNAKKSDAIHLQYGLSLKALAIKTDQVKEVYANEMDVKSLNLNLMGTDFRTERNSYDQLSITAAGKSEINVNGSDNGKSYLIKNLVINTLDAASFKLENIKVDQCSGSFSDQTTVQMPAVNLNQMFKK